MRRISVSTAVFFFQAEDGIRDVAVTGVQTCALPISLPGRCRKSRVRYLSSVFKTGGLRMGVRREAAIQLLRLHRFLLRQCCSASTCDREWLGGFLALYQPRLYLRGPAQTRGEWSSVPSPRAQLWKGN